MSFRYREEKERELAVWAANWIDFGCFFTYTDQKPPEQLTLNQGVTPTHREDLADVSEYCVQMHHLTSAGAF